MTTKTRNRLIVFCILAFPFIVLFGFLVSQIVGPLPPIQPLPNPNGYDDFVKAGEMVSTNSWNYDSTNLEQLRETVAANAEALALARAGLSNECRVPLQFSKVFAENHIPDLVSVRRVAQAFIAQGRLAEMQNQFSDAAKAYLDAIRLGNESGRGGILIDAMIGAACDSLGVQQLQKITGELDAKSCRETAATLETLRAQRQTWNEIMQQESDWSRRTFGLRGQILKLFYHSRIKHNFQLAIDTMKSTQKKEAQLLIDLAARANELDKGKPPANVADLVPDYLKSIPQDPFTGTNMVYSPQ
jgi:hypothetical protein